MKLNLVFLCLLFTVFSPVLAQEAVPSTLVLQKGTRQKTIKNFRDLSLWSLPNAKRISFQADLTPSPTLQLQGDTLIASVYQSNQQQEMRAGDFKTISTEYPLSEPGVVKINTNDLDRIVVGRSFIKISSGLLSTLSLLSAVAIAPAMAVGHNFNYTAYRNVVGVSLGAAASFLLINITLGSKTYHFHHPNQNKNWHVVRVKAI